MKFKMKKMKMHAIFTMFAALRLLSLDSGFHFFDHKKLTEIQGQVLRIEFAEVYGKKSAFLMLSIQSEDQRLFQVEVCPRWFLAVDIAVGMKMRIRGSLLETPTAELYLIAQEISFQGERIALRDGKGFPLWSHGGADGGGNRKGSKGRGRR